LEDLVFQDFILDSIAAHPIMGLGIIMGISLTMVTTDGAMVTMDVTTVMAPTGIVGKPALS